MDLQAQASRAAQQGQQLLTDDRSKASTFQGQYTGFNKQASQANANLQAQTKYMQGAGSGENTYNRNLTSMEDKSGFNPAQLSDANKSLFSMTGAMNSANQSFSQPGGVGAYGMSAPALASYEGSILNPLQTGVANANTQVGTLNTELGTLQTGANQATTNQVQSEQNVVTGLDSAVKNYQSQAAAALQSMQFYSDLARQQGGMNAQMQQSYATAVQQYAAASQAEAQAGYLISQTKGQNLINQQTMDAMDAAKAVKPTVKPAAPAPPTPNASHADTGLSLSNWGSGLGSWIKDGGFIGDMGRGVDSFAGGLWKGITG